ncbi:SDR family oxidoreductase [Ottowia sp.]|uniref:SDR family oxidoreductase n=1 Tax=Ottowia sp. TaxID=1898956 RepID=UPI002C4F098D|nr:SDR family oxidoreductase [Ottowia sp.]HOB65126.1 SDR family oxidoreductase [Ottowia sp.]HPZ56239.1 SDR family oxidoreductase [Ottowia sp.]HQD46595.1 SDR family oxidoreductase [Ottowia sp.]
MSTVLIIGASRGIGWELARQYVAAGERVIATARDDAGLARLRELGAQALRVDVADPASISGLAWQLDGEKIDTALYVAGVTSHGDATEPPTREAFDAVMHANVLGAMQAIPQVAPLLAPGGRFGFVSSVMGRIATVDNSRAWVYRVSKAALNMAVASAQSAWPDAIMVCLHPGWVQTDMGGAGAPVTLDDSATGLRRVMAGLTASDRGAFLQYDGKRLPTW